MLRIDRLSIGRSLRRQGQERWPCLAAEVGCNRVGQIDKRAAAALGAGRHRGPNAFAPATPRFAARALRDLAINDQKAELLLHAVVGRFHARSLKKGEVVPPVVAESLGEILGLRTRRRPPQRVENLLSGTRRFPSPTLLG